MKLRNRILGQNQIDKLIEDCFAISWIYCAKVRSCKILFYSFFFPDSVNGWHHKRLTCRLLHKWKKEGRNELTEDTEEDNKERKKERKKDDNRETMGRFLTLRWEQKKGRYRETKHIIKMRTDDWWEVVKWVANGFFRFDCRRCILQFVELRSEICVNKNKKWR